MRLAVVMAAQPDSRPSARQRERSSALLCEVLELNEHRLRRQATKHVELPGDADDALQSAYALFIERYNGLGEPLAWLYTTVKREAWSIHKRPSRRRETSLNGQTSDGGEFDFAELLPADAPGPEDRLARKKQLARRREALATLKPDERKALWLLGLGLSYAEICQTTGWTYTNEAPSAKKGTATVRFERP